MSDIVLTLIGAVSGAVAGAFLQPVCAAAISSKSNLLVTVSLYPFSTPNVFKKLIRSTEGSNQRRQESDSNIERRLWIFEHFIQYIEVVITNKGRKTINNVSISFANNQEFLADITLNGKYDSTVVDNSINVETLLPGSKCRIYIWANGSGSDIKVTANEYDRIKYKHNINYINMDNYCHIHKLYVSFAAMILISLGTWFVTSRIFDLILHKTP